MTAHADGHVESTLAMDISEARLLKRSLGRIGHDLSNLLTPLTAYPDLIRMELPEAGKSLELLEVIVDTTSDLVRMARRMQDLSLCDDFRGQLLSLNDLVAATVSETAAWSGTRMAMSWYRPTRSRHFTSPSLVLKGFFSRPSVMAESLW